MQVHDEDGERRGEGDHGHSGHVVLACRRQSLRVLRTTPCGANPGCPSASLCINRSMKPAGGKSQGLCIPISYRCSLRNCLSVAAGGCISTQPTRVSLCNPYPARFLTTGINKTIDYSTDFGSVYPGPGQCSGLCSRLSLAELINSAQELARRGGSTLYLLHWVGRGVVAERGPSCSCPPPPLPLPFRALTDERHTLSRGHTLG